MRQERCACLRGEAKVFDKIAAESRCLGAGAQKGVDAVVMVADEAFGEFVGVAEGEL